MAMRPVECVSSNVIVDKSILVSFYSARGGGVEEDLPEIVEGLLSSGWKVHLISPKGLVTSTSEDLFRYETSPLDSRPMIRSMTAFFYSLRVLIRTLVVFKKHGVSATYLMLLQDTPVGILLKFLRRDVRMIYSIHSDAVGLTLLGKPTWPKPILGLYISFLKAVEKSAIRESDLVLFVSEGLRSRIRERYPGLEFCNSRVIPNSVDGRIGKQTDSLHEHIGSTHGPVVGFLGKITRAKGVYDLLYAYEIVKRRVPGAVLVFVGEGPDESNLRMQARERSIRDVHFLGWWDEVGPLVSGFDILVLPSHSEGFGKAILVGMACGIVTLGSRIDGLVDVLKHECLMFPPGDIKALSDMITTLLTDEAKMNKARELCSRRLQDFLFSRPQLVVAEINRISMQSSLQVAVS